jgi:hypothetical protein
VVLTTARTNAQNLSQQANISSVSFYLSLINLKIN